MNNTIITRSMHKRLSHSILPLPAPPVTLTETASPGSSARRSPGERGTHKKIMRIKSCCGFKCDNYMDLCCSCADQRPHNTAAGYRAFSTADASLAIRVARSFHYCPKCKIKI